MAVSAPRIYEGTRIPSPIPTMLVVPEELRSEADILEINFGPNHPSTHGVLRLVVSLDGERVVGIYAVIGYLHTGFEKSMESKTWWKAITYPTRMDYLSFQQNEICFVMAIEKLLEVEPPPKAVWMRTLLAELARIHSHLVWLGTTGLELGAISMFWYCFRERDLILDLFELVTGVRMHTRSTPGTSRQPAPITGKYLSITSYRRDGSGVSTPVWFVAEGGRMLAETAATSGKAKRIRRNPSVTVAPCSATGRLRGEPTPAHVEFLPPSEEERAKRLFSRKYRFDLLFIRPIRAIQAWRHPERRNEEAAILAITPDRVPRTDG